MSTAESGLMCSHGARISVREDVMRKPTDDFFSFSYRSVKAGVHVRERERERDESLSVGIYVPHLHPCQFLDR